MTVLTIRVQLTRELPDALLYHDLDDRVLIGHLVNARRSTQRPPPEFAPLKNYELTFREIENE